MKRFINIILLGLSNILISIMAIIFVVLSVMLLIEIVNIKGFLVIGLLFSSILLIVFGFLLIYFLGYMIKNGQENLKRQDKEY